MFKWHSALLWTFLALHVSRAEVDQDYQGDAGVNSAGPFLGPQMQNEAYPPQLLRCCKNIDCSQTCIANEGESCLRGYCGPKERLNHDFCPKGCGFGNISITVAAGQTLEKESFENFCGRLQPVGQPYPEPKDGYHLCNKEPSKAETCKWAKPFPIETLQCKCNPQGMSYEHNNLMKSLKNAWEDKIDLSDFASKLCLSSENAMTTCNFSSVVKYLEGKGPQFNHPELKKKYYCRYQGRTAGSSFEAFGCDIRDTKDPCEGENGCVESRLVTYTTRSPINKKMDIYCKDFFYCNELTADTSSYLLNLPKDKGECVDLPVSKSMTPPDGDVQTGAVTRDAAGSRGCEVLMLALVVLYCVFGKDL